MALVWQLGTGFSGFSQETGDDAGVSFSDDVHKFGIHHSLEYCWCIPESEWHHCWFEQSLVGFEHCLTLVSFPESYVVIPCMYIQSGEEPCVLYFDH